MWVWQRSLCCFSIACSVGLGLEGTSQVVLLQCWDANTQGGACEHLGVAVLLPEWFVGATAQGVFGNRKEPHSTLANAAMVWCPGIAGAWPQHDWLPLAALPGAGPASGSVCLSVQVSADGSRSMARDASEGHDELVSVPTSPVAATRRITPRPAKCQAGSGLCGTGTPASAGAGRGAGAGARRPPPLDSSGHGAGRVDLCGALPEAPGTQHSPGAPPVQAATKASAGISTGGSTQSAVSAPQPPAASAMLALAVHVHTKYCDRDSKVRSHCEPRAWAWPLSHSMHASAHVRARLFAGLHRVRSVA